MGKRQFKPGNMLYPVPAVLVTAADREGNSNIFTVAWAGTICTNPPMLSISVRPERHSYHMMKETGEFVVNLTTESMAWATDYCGVRSGRDVDKWKETGLTPVNIIVARTADKDNELYKKVVDYFRTPEVAKVIEETYKGAYIPTWE